jgi:BirA family biotin operon repressor/biotin-[acetyl-CoA-carboxylase] ligase
MSEISFITWLPECHSTNAYLSDLVKKSPNMTSCCVATQVQTAGKGQPGKSWESEPFQNITFSYLFVLPPDFKNLVPFNKWISVELKNWLMFQLVVSSIKQQVKIKWPNDLYVGDRKIAGLLIEKFKTKDQQTAIIVGVGLNLNQMKFTTANAVSLAQITGNSFDVVECTKSLVEKFSQNLEKFLHHFAFRMQLEFQYTVSLLGLGQERLFETEDGEIKGIIEGVDDAGRLMVKHDKVKRYRAGSIRFL